MPPTPVAAPWKGSTALGWLWDPTWNATASPPPTSTTPAFSPGPMSTCGPSLGSRRSSRRECLYPQCSDHISDSIASSTSPGARPSRSMIRAYSPSVSPSCRYRSSSEDVLLDMGSHRLEDPPAIRRPGQRIDRVLGVPHQTEDVPGLVAHPGDVAQRAVRVVPGRVAQQHLTGRLQPVELVVGGVVAAGRVLDRDRQPREGRGGVGGWGGWEGGGRGGGGGGGGSNPKEPVNGPTARTTSSSTCRKTNFKETFGRSAPGSKPASHSTWNPLQMPSTSPPSRANSSTSAITGANRAIAPARR